MLHDRNNKKQPLQRIVSIVTEAIRRRSSNTRKTYLNRTQLRGYSQTTQNQPAVIGIIYQEEPFLKTDHIATALKIFVKPLIKKGFSVFFKKMTCTESDMAYEMLFNVSKADVLLFLGETDQTFYYQLLSALKIGARPVIFLPISFFYNTSAFEAKELTDLEHAPSGVPLSWLLLEVFGLLPPGAAFLPAPYAVKRLLKSAILHLLQQLAQATSPQLWLSRIMSVENLVNGIVMLLAIGGSAYFARYILSIAHEAGWEVAWDDLDRLSKVVPILTQFDTRRAKTSLAFQRAGGTSVLLYRLAIGGLLHTDSASIFGPLEARLLAPERLAQGSGSFPDAQDGIRSVDKPLSPCSGFKLLHGNLGRACAEVSLVPKNNRVVIAPALVCHSGEMLEAICRTGQIKKDTVIILTHIKNFQTVTQKKILDQLQTIQAKGIQLGLITDFECDLMESTTIPTVIQLPQGKLAPNGLNMVQTGDMIVLDLLEGRVDNLVNRQGEVELPSMDMVGVKFRIWEGHSDLNHNLFSKMQFKKNIQYTVDRS